MYNNGGFGIEEPHERSLWIGAERQQNLVPAKPVGGFVVTKEYGGGNIVVKQILPMSDAQGLQKGD